MFGLYNRLRLHVSASNRDVIAAVRRKIRKQARRDPAHRAARHALYRNMIAEHQKARDLFQRYRF